VARRFAKSKIYLLLAFFGISQLVDAQGNMKVTRSQIIPWSSPVTNIAVDAENIKWVGHNGQLVKVYGLALSANDGLKEGEKSLALYKGGDADIRWNSTSLRNITGDIFDASNYITCGTFDPGKKEMWLGTSQTGVFRVKVNDDGSLKLIEQLTTGNSRLKSNVINDILIDFRKRIWIGTDDGVLMGESGKWELLEKGLLIESIAANADDVWLMGDGLVGKVNRKGTWVILDIPSRRTEGDLRDIAVDALGQLWIASGVVTRYNPEDERYTVFGPAQEYTSQFATAIAVDQDGAIWVGTRDKGLYVIQEADAFAAFCEVDQPVDCNGNGSDGALRVRVDGGTPPYQYQWPNGLSGENPSGLQPGNYEVTVTDSKGNQVVASATLEDQRIAITVAQDTPAGPGATNGVATVDIQQGAAPFSYKWDNGEASQTASQLSPGPHQVSVTDKNGCQAVASLTITESLAELTVEAIATDIKCAGSQDAELELVVNGGQQPYTFQWNKEGLEGQKATGLGAGTYEVVVTDAAGNQKSILRSISEPAGMQLRTQVNAPASTGNNDGEASVNARGGEEPYRFAWDSGEATQQATQLNPGIHTVTVTDNKGCTAVDTVEITEDILPLQLNLIVATELSCFGSSDAILEAEVRGGKAPYQYQWEGSSSNNERAEGLAEGKYGLVVVDASGQQARVETAINAKEELKAEAQVESPASTGNEDGQASIRAVGGTAPYTYRWDNGEADPLAKALSPGTHSFTVTDANNCTAEGQVEITEDILPLQLNLIVATELSCFGSSDAILEAEVRGGKAPYQYQWEGSSSNNERAEGLAEGKYGLVVVDASGQQARVETAINAKEELKAEAQVESPASTGNEDGQASIQAVGGTAPYTYRWDNGEADPLAKALSPGTHSFTVTDANNCTAEGQVEITEDILPLQLSINAVRTLDCSGDANAALRVEVRGGKPPYTYAWAGVEQTTATVEGLAAGEYTVVVTDASGQKAQRATNLTAPEALTINATVIAPANTGQSDGRASLELSGGTSPFSYNWDNGNTTANPSDLSPGNHRVTVTDANGCSAVTEVEIGEDIQPLTVGINIQQALSCSDKSDAILLAEVNGGKPPYSYRWVEANSASNILQNAGAGTYNLIVQDASGLEQEATETLTAPAALEVVTQLQSPASVGNADGAAIAEVKGGTPPYDYAWSSGGSTDAVEGLGAGTETVVVTDANGCKAEAAVEVTENILPLQLTIAEENPVKCKDGNEGKLVANVRGGKPPYFYDWSHNSLNSPEAEGLVAGAYSLTVTDVMDTEQVISYQLEEPAKLTLKATVTAPASTGNADGKAKVTASGGTGNYTYQWQNGNTSPEAENLTPGFHRVVVTDERGCEASTNFEVTEDILPLELALELTKPISCANANDASLQAEINGGKPPYELSWSEEGMSGEQPSQLAPGNYALTVTDVLGTSSQANITIEAVEPLALELTENIPAFSDNSNDGKATAAASGGSPPYRFDWDTGESGKVVASLPLGQHSVTVTDANGCTQSLSFETSERIMKELASGALRSGQTMSIQKLQFDADSTRLREDARPVLDEIFGFLEENPTIVVEIGGHTNSLPPPEYCDSLSTSRARSVAEYLVNRGIAAERVYYKGYGKRDPLFSNKTEEGRRRNQRVEIKILRL
jgi:outer membrane protein OmpA-like peptidoglycan-associated protein/sugar lactone lactonase YvrE